MWVKASTVTWSSLFYSVKTVCELFNDALSCSAHMCVYSPLSCLIIDDQCRNNKEEI